MQSLEQRIAALSQPLEPLPTNVEPVLNKLPRIRAVVFDVYGTLLVSGSGDISLASEASRGDAASAALAATEIPGSDAVDGDALVDSFLEHVRAAHKASPSETPEVEIREIWVQSFQQFKLPAKDQQIERFAIEYECRVNPIWPMPGLAETIDGLQSKGQQLGIISNAQFFTPLAFEPLTGKTLEAWGFDSKLGIWSYEHREAKPGTELYKLAAAALAEQAIAPSETLFVGNDLRNDVWPAQKIGMRTALFAGDARSLRLRRDDDRLTEVHADAVITELRQLLEIVDQAEESRL